MEQTFHFKKVEQKKTFVIIYKMNIITRLLLCAVFVNTFFNNKYFQVKADESCVLSSTTCADIPSTCNGNVILSETVTSIASSAFSGCHNLKSISIPSSVTTIGTFAFYSSGLETVTFADNSVITNIGSGTFQGCAKLTNIIIPESVTSIGPNAFEGCGSLTSVTIPSSVTDIGTDAFSMCDSLSNVEIPSSVTTIGNTAFQYSGLETVTFADNSALKSIGSSAFIGCAELTSITIPSSVTTIGNYAFQSSGLESVTFVNSSIKKTIGYYAFYMCNSLKDVTIPSSVATISPYAFSQCDSLNTATIDDCSVTKKDSTSFDTHTEVVCVTGGAKSDL